MSLHHGSDPRLRCGAIDLHPLLPHVCYTNGKENGVPVLLPLYLADRENFRGNISDLFRHPAEVLYGFISLQLFLKTLSKAPR